MAFRFPSKSSQQVWAQETITRALCLNRIKVTVGLCVKDCQKTIGNSVDSIIEQDFPHECLETIVVDGESKDQTVSLIKDRLSKTNIRLRVFSDRGEGLGMARSIAVNQASGEYIVWVDGDVTLPKGHIREQVKFMEQNPRVGMARARWSLYTGTRLVPLLESTRSLNFKIRDLKTKATSQLLGTAGSTCRTKALRQVGNFDTHITGAGEDIDIAVRIKAAGWIISVNQEVNHRFRETWKDLWNEYFWWGYGAHLVNHKHVGSISVWGRFPPVAFALGTFRLSGSYRATHSRAVLLLPLHRIFTGTAWLVGLVSSHADGYGHPDGSLLKSGQNLRR